MRDKNASRLQGAAHQRASTGVTLARALCPLCAEHVCSRVKHHYKSRSSDAISCCITAAAAGAIVAVLHAQEGGPISPGAAHTTCTGKRQACQPGSAASLLPAQCSCSVPFVVEVAARTTVARSPVAAIACLVTAVAATAAVAAVALPIAPPASALVPTASSTAIAACWPGAWGSTERGCTIRAHGNARDGALGAHGPVRAHARRHAHARHDLLLLVLTSCRSRAAQVIIRTTS
mmetsp:Transcript_7063/g.18976  ORF Transcript_7063/g.18976 Transcript_7063/m.18976 type:complete len:234 (-) Transcript_7063:1981-2682(-)